MAAHSSRFQKEGESSSCASCGPRTPRASRGKPAEAGAGAGTGAGAGSGGKDDSEDGGGGGGGGSEDGFDTPVARASSDQPRAEPVSAGGASDISVES